VSAALKDEIARALAPLVGLPVWGPDRDSNMLALQLGERRASPIRDDPAREVGAYALHVFCAWRLVRGAVILAGSGDLFTPADPDEELESFDYDATGATWWDEQVAAHLGGGAERRVTMAEGDALGGARLTFDDGAVLELFPNSSRNEHFETEFWRVIDRGASAAPFAVGTFGVDRTLDA
jgi:hypothetical protein